LARANWADLVNNRGTWINYDAESHWHGCVRVLEAPGSPTGRFCLDVVVGAASTSTPPPSLREAAVNLLHQLAILYREAGLTNYCRFTAGQIDDLEEGSDSAITCED